ncbi:AMP-binding protein [Shewanella litorisediminis]|uniref:Acyl-CoA synthetase n=1 Tax=Shewanella litorisediminis TaxID=1173586 RepID=A0ABX7G2V5_9GAMM|nr:AMP-binding protein [Shewanella litorisediminis]MCL2917116.1 AMP-binding protein [Shewanella litorisediminis]QRH01593.1 acyl-CoA synthetase [Shewanella litorisediminis]
MTSLLYNALTRGPAAQQLISFNHHDILTGALFTTQVHHLWQTLSQKREQRWLLSCESSDLFAIGLCAGLLAGKELVLPPNTQSGTLSQLTQNFDAVLSDVPLCEGHAWVALKKETAQTPAPWPDAKPSGSLILYTSGSSGEPKAVKKTLEQLDIEVSTLEATFAAALPHCSVIATVSHQHIYGLLFKILWPLAAGRPFLSDLVEYPETLSYYTALLPNLCLISSPAQLSRLPDALENERQLHSPSLVFSSGGPLSEDAAHGIQKVYGSLPIEVYGSTETGGIGWRRQASSTEAWQAFPGIEIASAEDGALLLRSPYLDNPAEVLRLEDKIAIDDNGRFVLQGRLDRIVKIEEKRLSLVQMETLLESHPLVSRAALVLLTEPRTQLGAVVELSDKGKALLAEEGKLALNNQLKAHLLTEFERVTLPRRWRYPDELPLNQQGKRVHQTLIELFTHD